MCVCGGAFPGVLNGAIQKGAWGELTDLPVERAGEQRWVLYPSSMVVGGPYLGPGGSPETPPAHTHTLNSEFEACLPAFEETMKLASPRPPGDPRSYHTKQASLLEL